MKKNSVKDKQEHIQALDYQRTKLSDIMDSLSVIYNSVYCGPLSSTTVFSAIVLLNHASGDYDKQIVELERKVKNQQHEEANNG